MLTLDDINDNCIDEVTKEFDAEKYEKLKAENRDECYKTLIKHIEHTSEFLADYNEYIGYAGGIVDGYLHQAIDELMDSWGRQLANDKLNEKEGENNGEGEVANS